MIGRMKRASFAICRKDGGVIAFIGCRKNIYRMAASWPNIAPTTSSSHYTLYHSYTEEKLTTHLFRGKAKRERDGEEEENATHSHACRFRGSFYLYEGKVESAILY